MNVSRRRANSAKGFLHRTVGKRRSDARGARHPSHRAFDADPNVAQNDLDALRIRENPRPSAADFLPAKKQVPAGLNALDAIVVRPHGFHLGHIERFERGVKALICEANGFFTWLLL